MSDISDNTIKITCKRVIQITEKMYIISVTNEETKENILLTGFSPQGKHFHQCENKDALFKMFDCTNKQTI